MKHHSNRSISGNDLKAKRESVARLGSAQNDTDSNGMHARVPTEFLFVAARAKQQTFDYVLNGHRRTSMVAASSVNERTMRPRRGEKKKISRRRSSGGDGGGMLKKDYQKILEVNYSFHGRRPNQRLGI